MNKEKLWLDRLIKYKQDYKEDEHQYKVCSWWLRLEYNDETPTAQINYWLNKSVEKGILLKETNCYYTRYWLKEEETNGI